MSFSYGPRPGKESHGFVGISNFFPFIFVPEIETDNLVEQRRSAVPVLLGEELVAALVDPFAHDRRADLPLEPADHNPEHPTKGSGSCDRSDRPESKLRHRARRRWSSIYKRAEP